MAKDKLTDQWKMKDKKVVRIARKNVREAIVPHVETFAAHLDLEGFCYIKVIRTGAHECFAQDVTSLVLKGEDPAGGKMTSEEIGNTFWKEPAMVKWAKPKPEPEKDHHCRNGGCRYD